MPASLALVTVWGILAWVWIARPSIIFVEGHVPVLAPAQAEAKARYSLFLERGRLDAYVAKHGTQPTELSEAGTVENGVTYHRGPRDFVLESTVGSETLRMTSQMSTDSFLGTALTQLRASQH